MYLRGIEALGKPAKNASYVMGHHYNANYFTVDKTNQLHYYLRHYSGFASSILTSENYVGYIRGLRCVERYGGEHIDNCFRR